jgi:hypothetical protein
VEPVRLIAVLDGLRLGFTRVPLYSLLFYCRAVGGTLQPHPSSAATWGGSPATPCPRRWSGSERWGEHVFAALAGEHRMSSTTASANPCGGATREDLMDLMALTVAAAETADGGLRDAVAT